MSVNTALLRKIPKIDDILRQENIEEMAQQCSHSILMESIRETLDSLRQRILAGEEDVPVEMADICEEVLRLTAQKNTMSLRPVINATGIILHTNLGRARLSDRAVEAIKSIAQDYNTLEYNLKKGARGSRYDHVEDLISKITGAEDAIVVNNNAAAVMLILSTMAKGREVITSRGELVEIGGAFRVPDIMAQSGGTLVEVGTTNKTHYSDYVNAIKPETGALLKVHTSNFKIMGFFEEVTLEEMVEIGHSHNLPVIYDLGSGALVRLQDYGIQDEPNVLDAMKSGVDILSFSGDKLLGGPQAGIIIGKREYIENMKKNPLTRAFRIDKLTLAALEATLRDYLDPEVALKSIPTLQMMCATKEELLLKGQKLFDLLNQDPQGYTVELTEDYGQIGGGSVPTQMIPSVVIALKTTNLSLDTLEKELRAVSLPIIARISKERMLFDVRTIEERHFSYINETLRKLCMK
ncbi:MAG: L-seryl-tRNA(Sec) selenium transferase [Negativibacillus sp.]